MNPEKPQRDNEDIIDVEVVSETVIDPKERLSLVPNNTVTINIPPPPTHVSQHEKPRTLEEVQQIHEYMENPDKLAQKLQNSMNALRASLQAGEQQQRLRDAEKLKEVRKSLDLPTGE